VLGRINMKPIVPLLPITGLAHVTPRSSAILTACRPRKPAGFL
jgi:hypothetical protein